VPKDCASKKKFQEGSNCSSAAVWPHETYTPLIMPALKHPFWEGFPLIAQ